MTANKGVEVGQDLTWNRSSAFARPDSNSKKSKPQSKIKFAWYFLSQLLLTAHRKHNSNHMFYQHAQLVSGEVFNRSLTGQYMTILCIKSIGDVVSKETVCCFGGKVKH